MVLNGKKVSRLIYFKLMVNIYKTEMCCEIYDSGKHCQQ